MANSFIQLGEIYSIKVCKEIQFQWTWCTYLTKMPSIVESIRQSHFLPRNRQILTSKSIMPGSCLHLSGNSTVVTYITIDPHKLPFPHTNLSCEGMVGATDKNFCYTESKSPILSKIRIFN